MSSEKESSRGHNRIRSELKQVHSQLPQESSRSDAVRRDSAVARDKSQAGFEAVRQRYCEVIQELDSTSER